jgi:hypothetical protein
MILEDNNKPLRAAFFFNFVFSKNMACTGKASFFQFFKGLEPE